LKSAANLFNLKRESNNKMSDGRHRLSGYEYRQQAAKRKSKESEVIAKTRKLSDYFSSNQTSSFDNANSATSELSDVQTSNCVGEL